MLQVSDQDSGLGRSHSTLFSPHSPDFLSSSPLPRSNCFLPFCFCFFSLRISPIPFAFFNGHSTSTCGRIIFLFRSSPGYLVCAVRNSGGSISHRCTRSLLLARQRWEVTVLNEMRFAPARARGDNRTIQELLSQSVRVHDFKLSCIILTAF